MYPTVKILKMMKVSILKMIYLIFCDESSPHKHFKLHTNTSDTIFFIQNISTDFIRGSFLYHSHVLLMILCRMKCTWQWLKKFSKDGAIATMWLHYRDNMMAIWSNKNSRMKTILNFLYRFARVVNVHRSFPNVMICWVEIQLAWESLLSEETLCIWKSSIKYF